VKEFIIIAESNFDYNIYI